MEGNIVPFCALLNYVSSVCKSIPMENLRRQRCQFYDFPISRLERIQYDFSLSLNNRKLLIYNTSLSKSYIIISDTDVSNASKSEKM